MLTDEQIKQFQALYQKHFGKQIGRQEAYDKGEKLVRLIEIICQPVTENKQ